MNCKPDKMKLSIYLLQPPNIPNEPKYKHIQIHKGPNYNLLHCGLNWFNSCILVLYNIRILSQIRFTLVFKLIRIGANKSAICNFGELHLQVIVRILRPLGIHGPNNFLPKRCFVVVSGTKFYTCILCSTKVKSCTCFTHNSLRW